MQTMWRRAQWALRDKGDRDGTVSIFLDYDLGRWCFGPRYDHDPCWFDFNFDLGPISLFVIYWRPNIVSRESAPFPKSL